MPEALLQVQDMHAHYGTSHVLQGVNLEVGQECLALLGRNGMGKTTLLRTVLGLNPPRRAGAITFGGKDITHLQSHHTAQLGIAYVPQGRKLFPSLSVHEHLVIAHRATDGRKEWTPDAVYELFPEIARRRRIPGTRLSGGEQQMLAIGRALVTNPKLLMMDEPSEGLAPVAVMRVLDACKRLLASGIAILLVEQNLKAAELIAQRVAVMVTGQVVHNATMEEFSQNNEAKKRYLGV